MTCKGRRWRWTPVILLAGCGWVPKGDLRTLEVQNRALSEQNRAQQAEIVNLREHQRKLEDRVIRSDAAVAAGERANSTK